MASALARKCAKLAVPILATIGFVADLRTRQGVDDGVWYLVALVLTLFIRKELLPLWLAGGFSVLTIVGFHFSPPGPDPSSALLNCGMGIGVLWTMAALIELQLRSNGALRRAEEKYRGIFENAVEGIYQSPSEGALLNANPAMAAIFGYASAREMMRTVHDIGQQIYANPVRHEEFKRLIQERGSATGFEFQSCRKDGAPIFVSASARAVLNSDGRLLYYEGWIQDITQRQQHEQEIERLNRLYATLSHVNQTIVRCQTRRELFNGISDVMIKFGKFRTVWISERVGAAQWQTAAQRGIEADSSSPTRESHDGCPLAAEAAERGCPAVCNSMLTNSRAKGCGEMLRTGVRSCAAFPFHLQNKVAGVFRICSLEADFFRADEVGLLEEIALDISYALDRIHEQEQRRQAEEALRLSQMKFGAAFANNPAAMALTRLDDGLLLEVNDTWTALNGFSRQEAIGRSVRTLGIWPSAEASARFADELRENGVLRGWEQAFRKKSGEPFVAELSAQVLTVGAEKMILSTFVNITERKRANEAIHSQLDELQRWHEAVLGREERVLELKSEVNELRALQGLPARYDAPILA